MIYVGPIFCALHCGGNGIAISHQGDARADRTNDELQLFLRKFHKAGELVCQSLLHIQRQLLHSFYLWGVYMLLLPLFLFDFFCNGFCFLGTAFHVSELLFPRESLALISWLRNCKIYKCLNIHLSFVCACENYLKIFQFDTFCKLSLSLPFLIGMDFKPLRTKGQ